MIKLEDGEEILYIARRHWFLFFSETVFMLFFAILPLLFVFIPVSAFNEGTITRNRMELLFAFFWSLWLMLLWVLFALLWTNYYLDI